MCNITIVYILYHWPILFNIIKKIVKKISQMGGVIDVGEYGSHCDWSNTTG